MSKEIDDYISWQNEKQAAAKLYNEAIHPPRQSSGIFALIVGVALGWILGSRKTLLSMAAIFAVTALVLGAPFAHAEWGSQPDPKEFWLAQRQPLVHAAQQTPKVGDVLVPKKPGTEIATVPLFAPRLSSGDHVPTKVCTDHARRVLDTVEVTLPKPSGTVLLMTGVTTDEASGAVSGWTLSNFSVEIRCQMDHDIVFFVVAGPNYEDGTASAILDTIKQAWNKQ